MTNSPFFKLTFNKYSPSFNIEISISLPLKELSTLTNFPATSKNYISSTVCISLTLRKPVVGFGEN
jgi:hypothetical protein